MNTVTVCRVKKRNGKIKHYYWDFFWHSVSEAYIYVTDRGTVYRIFVTVNKDQFDVWIGREFKEIDKNGKCQVHWCTWERELGVKWIEFFRGKIWFSK